MTKKVAPSTRGRKQAASDGEEGSFKVGYGKPPRHTQFKKGQSGNPRGRQRGRRSIRSIVLTTLEEKVWIREGERRRKVSKTEALIRTTVGRAIAGDQKAAAFLMALLRLTNLMSEQPDGVSAETLTREDELLLADFLSRHETTTPQSTPDSDASRNKQT